MDPVDDQDPGEDFTPGDVDAGSDGTVTLFLKMSQEEASALLTVVDKLQWNLVQIIGGRG